MRFAAYRQNVTPMILSFPKFFVILWRETMIDAEASEEHGVNP